MDKNQKEIISTLEPYLISVQHGVNTNNSWGFGGAIKDVYQYKYGDVSFSIDAGIASTRHGGTYPIFDLHFDMDIHVQMLAMMSILCLLWGDKTSSIMTVFTNYHLWGDSAKWCLNRRGLDNQF